DGGAAAAGDRSERGGVGDLRHTRAERAAAVVGDPAQRVLCRPTGEAGVEPPVLDQVRPGARLGGEQTGQSGGEREARESGNLRHDPDLPFEKRAAVPRRTSAEAELFDNAEEATRMPGARCRR